MIKEDIGDYCIMCKCEIEPDQCFLRIVHYCSRCIRGAKVSNQNFLGDYPLTHPVVNRKIFMLFTLSTYRHNWYYGTVTNVSDGRFHVHFIDDWPDCYFKCIEGEKRVTGDVWFYE